MKSKALMLLLCIVLLSAITLSCVLFLHYSNLGIQLESTRSELSVSRTAWETTAAEKEALQEDLTTLKNDLKEAELSLSEAQERSGTLKEDIDTLNQEISDLKTKLPE